jgi:hypothetical protein
MRKMMAMGFGLLLLGACTSTPNDVGVGFGSFDDRAQNRAARQAALRGTPATTTLPPAQTENTDIAAVADAAIAASETGPAQTMMAGNAAFSDEQDFGAVSARETIESDAERRQRMIEQRVEIAPTALPTRTGTTGPNIIEYAVSTTNPVGQQVYRRSGLLAGRSERNCRSYRSDNLAQEAFLRLGGPERDRQTLDPDGDGYACGWDPTVFRNAALAAQAAETE